MQLASHGLRPALGKAPKLLARSIHIPRPPAAAPQGAAARVVRTTRTLVGRFFAHLTTPGTLRAPAPATVRGFAQAATRGPTIAQGLSMPARHALARPLGAPCLPRAPAVPRNVFQVGLGTARAFHSGRPVFAALAENAPVGVRGLVEADLDIRFAGKDRVRAAKFAAPAEKKRKGKQALKENAKPVVRTEKEAVPEEKPTQQEELDTYFPLATVAPVTTYLLVPLAPTPTARTPLSEFPPAASTSSASSVSRLPLGAIGAMHAAHGTHTLRVATLFTRLDDARVWSDPGVRCATEALGGPDGVCTLLRITFDGWTADRVRAVLGDAGRGWAEIFQVGGAQDELDSVLGSLPPSSAVSDAGEPDADEATLAWADAPHDVDPAHSLILPTIDMSTDEWASVASTPAPSTPPSPLLTAIDVDWTDADSDSDGVLSEFSLSDDEDAPMFGLGHAVPAPAVSSVRSSWVGADIASVASREQVDGPREYMF